MFISFPSTLIILRKPPKVPQPHSATVSPACPSASAHTCAQTLYHDPPTGTLWLSQEAAYFLCVYLVDGHKCPSIITFPILCQSTLASGRWIPTLNLCYCVYETPRNQYLSTDTDISIYPITIFPDQTFCLFCWFCRGRVSL